MNRKSISPASARILLAVLAIGALGLAASPTALAHERGGPGRPGLERSAAPQGDPVLPRKFLPRRSVSWSD
jgi:hypothetical protein